MIKVTYHRNFHRVTVDGHANSGEPGHDLVCAGASALTYTLAANVSNLAGNGHVRIESMELSPGKAEISCKPRSGARSTVGLVFQSVCVGFEILAHDYPQYISYEILG